MHDLLEEEERKEEERQMEIEEFLKELERAPSPL